MVHVTFSIQSVYMAKGKVPVGSYRHTILISPFSQPAQVLAHSSSLYIHMYCTLTSRFLTNITCFIRSTLCMWQYSKPFLYITVHIVHTYLPTSMPIIFKLLKLQFNHIHYNCLHVTSIYYNNDVESIICSSIAHSFK